MACLGLGLRANKDANTLSVYAGACKTDKYSTLRRQGKCSRAKAQGAITGIANVGNKAKVGSYNLLQFVPILLLILLTC